MMSGVRIVKFDDLIPLIKGGGDDLEKVKIILDNDGKTVLYDIEIKRTVIPF